MKIVFLLFLGVALPIFAQDGQTFLQKISGSWKLREASSPENVAEYFNFSANGDLVFSINSGTEKKPKRTVVGRGRISILSSQEANSHTVEIFLDEEYSTNVLALRDGTLTLYSINPKNQKPFEKFSMERVTRP